METSHALHVSNLLSTATEERIATVFNVPREAVRICARLGQPSYAYINFAFKEEAIKAKELHAYAKIAEVSNELIVSDCNHDIAKQRPQTNFHLKNIRPGLTSARLDEICSRIGRVHSARVPADSRKIGFVQFVNLSDAQKFFENSDSLVRAIRKELADADQELIVRYYTSPAERSTEFTNIFVKNFPSTISVSEVADLVSEFGTVTEINTPGVPDIYVKVHKFADSSHAASACINFATMEQAQLAISKLDKSEYQNRILEATRHISASQRAAVALRERDSRAFELRSRFPNCNLMIHNLPAEVTNEDLKTVFSQFGRIERCGFDKDHRGWVLYSTYEAGNAAIESVKDLENFNGIALSGPINVIRVIRDYHHNSQPSTFPEGFNVFPSWRGIDAHEYASTNDAGRVEFRGNAIYEDIERIVGGMKLPDNLAKNVEEVVSRVTGMIISADWSADLAEFISFAENGEEVAQQVASAIGILKEEK